jgi:hypothetical protein
MLFVIDQSVEQLFASGSAGPLDVDGIDCLAMGVAEGSHRIIGSRQVLTNLSGQVAFQRKTRNVFQRALGRVAEEGKLKALLNVYGRIQAGPAAIPVSKTINNQREITFPLRWFDQSSKVQRTILLGEHLSDAHVLQKVAEAGAALANLNHLPIRCRPNLGGGSTISLVLAANISANSFCICIVDSDRACPGGTLGGTATSVQIFKNPTAYPLVEVMETTGRDLENHLPDFFYHAEYGSNLRCCTLAAMMMHLTSCGETDLRSHLDIENGVKLRQILAHPAHSPERNFWLAKLSIILNQVGTSALPCLATAICSAPARTPCTCAPVDGIPSNVLDLFASRYADSSPYQLAGWLDDSVRPEWHRLGSSIASWCCADERLRL